MSKMKAIVVNNVGGPDVLELESREIPQPAEGWVRIKIRAFGINRAELMARQGIFLSGTPRVLGIEAVGEIDDANGTGFKKGDKVATVMGGMGFAFDGSYAEFTTVPASQVRVVNSNLAWDKLGALPEMLQTAWGALFQALKLSPGEHLLVRGGTSSVGMAAIALAAKAGAHVTATTRNLSRAEVMKNLGADEVILDGGVLANDGHRFDKVLELVGTTTLADSLAMTDKGGAVCMAGLLGGGTQMPDFGPMGTIPHCVSLTTYMGNVADFMEMPLDDLLSDVETGAIPVHAGGVFSLEEVPDLHRKLEANETVGKLVVVL